MSLQKKIVYHPYLWMLLVCVIAYWPIAFQVFSIKNDNVMVFLAFRYNISEAIQQAHLPLWTPYMNLGFPMHADIQSGAWNPVVWFFSLFGRYNLSTLHLETMLYIFLAGAGMFHFLKKFIVENKIAFAFAVAYLLCGYMCDVAGNNILFLAGAAFTPWVLSHGYGLYKQPRYYAAVKLTVAFYFLFSAAYPFFTVVSGYILLFSFIYKTIEQLFLKKKNAFMITLKYWGLSAILFLLIAAPALYSYLQFLPEYSRGNHISLERSNENNLELRSFISLLFPNAPLKNGFIISDLTMRNAFIGLIPLVLVFSWLFIKNKTKREWLIFSGMIIGFLYAAGNVFPIHTIIFHTVPLMDHFRHPANARVFFTIAAVLLAVFTFNKIRHSKSSSLIFKITASIFATGIVIYLCTRNEYFYDDAFSPFKNFSFSNRETLKQTIDKFNNSFFIFSNALIQICFLTAISFFHYRPLKRFLFVLIFLNSFIFLQLSMPVTEVSKTSPADANDLLRSYTTGYPSPSLTKSIAYNSNTDSSQFILTGHNMFYNKNIGFPAINYNPTILNNIDSLLKNEKVFKKVMQQPFAFLDDTDTASALSVKLNSNNAMTFHSRSEVAASLHVQQTLTKNWKAFIDEKETDIHSSDIACMAVSLPPGEHTIKLIYQPPLMICLLITATITLLYCCLYLLVKSIKK